MELHELLLFFFYAFSPATGYGGWRRRHRPEDFLNYRNSLDLYTPLPTINTIDDTYFELDKAQKENSTQPTEKYSVEILKSEIIAIETNILCFLFNFCYYDSERYTSFVGDYLSNGNQSLDYYLTVKELLEDKYGTVFSKPIKDQQEQYGLRKPLFNKFVMLFKETISSWSDFLPGYNIYDDLFYDYDFGGSYRAFFTVMSKKDMETTLERIQILHGRSVQKTKRAGRYGFNSDAVVMDYPSVYQTAVNVDDELTQITQFIYRLLGYIFNMKPHQFERSLNFEKLKKEHPSVIVSFRRALQDLYGDIVNENNGNREVSSYFADFFSSYLTLRATMEEIYGFWWKRISILSQSEKDLYQPKVFLRDLLYINMLNATMSETVALENKLTIFKGVTFGTEDPSVLRAKLNEEK